MQKTVPFTKWQPIGVCDSAEAGKIKAQIFSRVDFDKIEQYGVNRQNWEQHPQMKALLLRYAKDVAKISSLTQSMKNPQVSQIKLVGMTMQLKETPFLNKESYDGRVQLFQVQFVDKPKTRYRFWLWVLLIVLIIALISISSFFYMFEFRSYQSTAFCSPYAKNYQHHLELAHRELNSLFQNHPTLLDLPVPKNTMTAYEQSLFERYQMLLSDPRIKPKQMPRATKCVRSLCQNSQRDCQLMEF